MPVKNKILKEQPPSATERALRLVMAKRREEVLLQGSELNKYFGKHVSSVDRLCVRLTTQPALLEELLKNLLLFVVNTGPGPAVTAAVVRAAGGTETAIALCTPGEIQNKVLSILVDYKFLRAEEKQRIATGVADYLRPSDIERFDPSSKSSKEGAISFDDIYKGVKDIDTSSSDRLTAFKASMSTLSTRMTLCHANSVTLAFVEFTERLAMAGAIATICSVFPAAAVTALQSLFALGNVALGGNVVRNTMRDPRSSQNEKHAALRIMTEVTTGAAAVLARPAVLPVIDYFNDQELHKSAKNAKLFPPSTLSTMAQKAIERGDVATVRTLGAQYLPPSEL